MVDISNACRIIVHIYIHMCLFISNYKCMMNTENTETHAHSPYHSRCSRAVTWLCWQHRQRYDFASTIFMYELQAPLTYDCGESYERSSAEGGNLLIRCANEGACHVYMFLKRRIRTFKRE